MDIAGSLPVGQEILEVDFEKDNELKKRGLGDDSVTSINGLGASSLLPKAEGWRLDGANGGQSQE